MVFPVVVYGCESWTVKKVECWRTDASELCSRTRLSLRVPRTARWSNKLILRETKSDYSLKWLMLKLQSFATWCEELTHWKRPWCWERLRVGEWVTEDEMVRWNHRLSGHEFEQTLGDNEGQESLACCSPWGHKESDTTKWLNKNSNWHHRNVKYPKRLL